MKKLSLFGTLILLLMIGACQRDDDENGQPEENGLEAFLNGRFEVTQVEYNGTITIATQSIPVQGTDDDTEGFYDFDREGAEVNYEVSGEMVVEFFGQILPVPIEVESESPFEIVSETRFVLNDPEYGTMTYDVEDRSENRLICSTNFDEPSQGINIDMRITMNR